MDETTTPAGQPVIAAVQPMQTKFPGPITLLKEAWQIYKERFWLLIGIYFIPAALIIVFAALAGGAFTIGALTGVKTSVVLVIAGVILAVLVYLAIIYIALWAQTALLFAIKGADQKLGFKESFKQASHKVFSLFGASLLVGLSIGGLMLLGGAIIFALYAILPKIAVLFFVEGILGLILALWIFKYAFEFSLASYVVVGDNTRALSAVQRSRDYVKGYWWKVFLRFLFLIVVAVAYSIITGLIVSIFKAIPGLTGVIVSVLVNLILSVILPPLYVAYGYLIYSHLRAIKGESQIPADKKSVGLIILAVIVVIVFCLGVPIVLLSLNSARAKSRDALRIADARIVMSAAELYLNDYQTYPRQLSDSGYFQTTLLVAPTPPDGSCTADQNTFQYTLIDAGHYKFTFCLGSSIGGYSAGPHTLTEQGIQ